MVDCTVTENFLKERKRMCESTESCQECRIRKVESAAWCKEYCENHPSEVIAAVQKWSDENPQKTFFDDLKEKFPLVRLNPDGYPGMCPCDLGYEPIAYCATVTNQQDCKKCWDRPCY